MSSLYTYTQNQLLLLKALGSSLDSKERLIPALCLFGKYDATAG